MNRRLELAKTLLRLGPDKILLNGIHRLKLKSGHYRLATPATTWDAFKLTPKGRSPFAMPSQEALLAAGADPQEINGDLILKGQLIYFSRDSHPIPLDWVTHPITGKSPSKTKHWSNIPFFDEEVGDIKWVWEPSRFDWAVELTRSYAITRDTEYAECFWRLLESWRISCPPNTGPAWMCGQECSLRIWALTLAATLPGTEEQHHTLWQTVEALAERVSAAIGYALSQDNNHGISEACGLYVAGCCLPDHPEAGRWIEKGKALLAKQCEEQFRPDGSYTQNSVNYQRLALRGLQMAMLCAKRFGDTLPEEIEAAARRGSQYLISLMEPETGQLPNIGGNDGAYALHLSFGEYGDFRPAMASLTAMLDGVLISSPEEALWFIGEDVLNYPTEKCQTSDISGLEGGVFSISDSGTRAVLRSQKHDSRPADADALHLDVWMGGMPVVCDSGSYSYFDKEAAGWFKSTAAHSTVEIGGESQMVKASRFLWIDWTQAEIEVSEPGRLVGSHDGYVKRFGATHRREVVLVGSTVVVIDDVIGGSAESVLRWRLNGVLGWSFADVVAACRSASVQIFGSESEWVTQGLEASQSLFYGELTSAPVLKSKAVGTHRWITVIGGKAEASGDVVTVQDREFRLTN